jgi:hypothetical protein
MVSRFENLSADEKVYLTSLFREKAIRNLQREYGSSPMDNSIWHDLIAAKVKLYIEKYNKDGLRSNDKAKMLESV